MGNRPKHYRVNNCCDCCKHISYHIDIKEEIFEIKCLKHDFDIECNWTAENAVCDDFEEDE